jgi:3-hydroxybutyryl-CoA dehydratase
MTLVVGDALTPFIIESVSPEAMKEWAIFLADPNPIHLDPTVVKAMGLGDKVINQGPANVAYLINMLQAAIPGAVIEKMDNRFVDNAYAQDRLVASGTVTAVDGNRITCETSLIANGDRTVITGTALLKL